MRIRNITIPTFACILVVVSVLLWFLPTQPCFLLFSGVEIQSNFKMLETFRTLTCTSETNVMLNVTMYSVSYVTVTNNNFLLIIHDEDGYVLLLDDTTFNWDYPWVSVSSPPPFLPSDVVPQPHAGGNPRPYKVHRSISLKHVAFPFAIRFNLTLHVELLIGEKCLISENL